MNSRSLMVVFLLAPVWVPFAWAQSSDESRDAEIEQMKATMQEMSKTIKQLQGKVAELEKDKAEAKTKTQDATAKAEAGTPSAPAAANVPAAAALLGKPATDATSEALPSTTSQTTDWNTLLDDQWPAPRVGNEPIDPSLKGFMQIPGTSTFFRLGGSARLDVIGDSSNNGNPNSFIPSSFPVPGEPGAGGPSRSQVQAKGSRISFELRRPVPDGNLRIYYENDFFGDSSSSTMTYRLRHLYGQAWNFLVGQTFSNFMDIDAWPDVVDYNGPNGIVNARQPQIRYTQPFLGTRLQLAVAVEQPGSQINTGNSLYGPNANTVNRLPDLTAHLRYEDKSFGHVQLGGIYRYLSYRNDATDQGVPGWGVSLGGDFDVFQRDNITVQGTYGHGIARYIQDPSGQNEDAALDNNGHLIALPAWGLSVGYTHQWTDRWKSTVCFSRASVQTEDSNGAYAYKDGNYASANLVYQPTPNFRIGLEYLYGADEVRNGSSHDGQRLDLVVKYDFVK